MSSFAKWYIRQLQNAPMRTNMCSATVVMGVGDFMAQKIEQDEESDANDPVVRLQRRLTNLPEEPSLKRRLSFRRYGTLSPERRRNRLLRQQPAEWEWAEEVVSWSQLREACRIVGVSLQQELASLDGFRTVTMVVWASIIYTPFYVQVYRLFDRVLPKGTTPMAVSSRVGLSFLLSIPTNAAFFCYGSFVHHTTEWLALIQERQSAEPSASYQQLLEAVPLDLEMAISVAWLKVKAELWTTVQASAGLWVPFNLLNFSAVPPHLRPLGLMICSSFWNCYLSLAQHRSEGVEE